MTKVVKVRKHYRKGRNKVTVVRQHSRNTVGAKISVIRDKYKINTPIQVSDADANSFPSDSYAFTDTTLVDDKPTDHVINLNTDKIMADGEDADKVIEHEIAHIIDKEKGLMKSRFGKNFMAAVQQTDAYKKLQEVNDNYQIKPEELFARAYAQFRTGSISPQDILNGYAWEPKDFKLVAKQIKKLVDTNGNS